MRKIDCARNCAHSIVAISITRSVEGVVESRVSVEATVFLLFVMGEPYSPRKFHEIRKCLRVVYLQDAR